VECSSPSPPTLTLPLKVSITFCWRDNRRRNRIS
jgi:hypothetical protein